MKTRKLVLNDGEQAAKLKFKLLYEGFLTGGATADPREPRNIMTSRIESKILDKFEAISQPEGNTRELIYRTDPPAVIELDQLEYEAVKKYFERCPWIPAISREVVGVADWLSSIPLE
jgi:hypothetical protein